MATTTNPDSTITTKLEDPRYEVNPPFIDAEPETAMSGLYAAQIALARLLAGIVVHVRSGERWLVEGNNNGAVRQVALKSVSIDAPDEDVEVEPLQASIIERQPQTFDDSARPRMLKEPWNGLLLRQLAETTCYLSVTAWFGHKNERRAYRSALTRALLAEPLTERGGRLIVVPEYFGRTVRLMLNDVQNINLDPQKHHWVLEASVTVYVEEIEAVRPPVKINPQIRPDIGTGVTP